MNKVNSTWIDIWQVVDSYDHFIVTSHVGPDGDNIGSCMAWTLVLKQMGKNAIFVLDDIPPTGLAPLLEEGGPSSSEKAEKLIKDKPFALFALDCANKQRLALSQSLIEKCKKIAVIDHHQSNEYFGDLNLVEPQISSTCQVVTQGILDKDSSLLSKSVAQCLYTGMITDTGRFLFGNYPAQTLRLAAELLDRGVDRNQVMDSLYRNNSINYTQLTGEVLSTMQTFGPICWMHLSQDMLRRHQVDYNDIEPLVDYAINLKGIEIGIFAKEKGPKEYRISLRSKNRIDVSLLAKKYNGGGHKAASGCTIEKTLDEVKNDLLTSCKSLYQIEEIKYPQI